MVNKKGLSNIIATVLIMLLALVAVVVVWQFVKPTLQKASTNIEVGDKCLRAFADPISCKDKDGETTVTVKQMQEDISKIMVVVEQENGETVVGTVPAPGLLSTVPVTLLTSNPVRARAAVIIKTEDGTDYTCPVSAAQVDCVKKVVSEECNGITQCLDYAFLFDCESDPNDCVTNECFFDQSICKDCTTINSCGDYLQTACSDDKCGKGDCKWSSDEGCLNCDLITKCSDYSSYYGECENPNVCDVGTNCLWDNNLGACFECFGITQCSDHTSQLECTEEVCNAGTECKWKGTACFECDGVDLCPEYLNEYDCTNNACGITSGCIWNGACTPSEPT